MGKDGWQSPSNVIAGIALCVSLLGAGWQTWNWWIGPEPALIDVEARSMEFRCNLSSKDRCWGIPGSNETPTGQIAIILPIFLTNTGASGYDTVVSRVFADIRFHDHCPQVTLVANQFWRLVQGSSNQSRPFSPFVVNAGGANGSELRFVAFAEEHVVLWHKIADDIVESAITSVEIDIRVELLDGEKLTTTCNVIFSDKLRQVMKDRRENRGATRLTATCTLAVE